MADLNFSVDIAVPPNEVFAFFVPQRMPLWYGREMRACFEVQNGASEFAVGQKLGIRGHLKGHALTLAAVITDYEWERRLEWQFEDSYGVRGSQRWELRVREAGLAGRNPPATSTRVSMSDSYRMPGPYARIVDFLLTRFAVSLRDRSWLDRLDRLATRR